VTMLLEYCLVLGFAVPVILPLTCLTVVLHLAVFHRATQHGFKLKMDAKPSSQYLQGSLLLGCALVMWFFLENDLHGQMLVVVGMPAMFLAAVALDKAVPLSEAPWAWLVTQEGPVVRETYSISVHLASTSGLVYKDEFGSAEMDMPGMGDAGMGDAVVVAPAPAGRVLTALNV